MDAQAARMKGLEVMLQQEREARALAEDLAKRLEESALAHMNGAAKSSVSEDSDDTDCTIVDETSLSPEDNKGSDATTVDSTMATATALQSRIDMMEGQMLSFREQMEQWKARCEVAEAERDSDRKTLAEMVVQLRAEEAKRVAQENERSRSRRGRAESQSSENHKITANGEAIATKRPDKSQVESAEFDQEAEDLITLSRANTITPLNPHKMSKSREPQHLNAALPYASMLSVVLIGVGLMAYLNGWQSPHPPQIEQ